MTRTDGFFQSKKPAAVLKHELLLRYLTPYVTMVGSWAKNVWVIDGYAGPGEYASDENGDAVSGSPRIICDLAAKQLTRGVQLHGIFIERNPVFARQLRRMVGSADPDHRLHEVLEGDTSTHLEAAALKAGADPLLIFLDPFGTALAFEVLCRAIRSRPRGKTEVLLNFNLEAVWRIGGLLTKRSGVTAADQKTLARADEFLGGTWWHRAFVEARTAGERGAASAAEQVAAKFRQMMHERTGLEAATLPIRRRPEHAPLFLLTHFYSHPAAPVKFLEAASHANQRWRAYSRRRDLEAELAMASAPTLFPAEWEHAMSDRDQDRAEQLLDAEWVQIIAANIEKLLEGRSQISVGQYLFEIYGTTVTLARDSHVHRAWDALALKGLVLPRKSGERYPKLWKQVVTRSDVGVQASRSTFARPVRARLP